METEVTIPAVTDAEISAPLPIAEVTDINGLDMYPAPPVTIPTDCMVPAADTTALNNALLGT